MVKKRERRSAARKRGSVILGGGALLLLVMVAFWSAIWPYLLGAGVLGGLGTGSWWLWRTDRLVRGRDRQWRQQDAIQAGHRTLAEVDKMSGTEFEELVAALCRRDGCTDIRRVGGAGDNGADVTGRLPDGRTMIIQCKRYTPRSTIAPREVRDLLGSKAHFGADLAVFVTTTRFSRQSEDLCVHNDILAIHRDHLGLWNNGATLQSLISINGSGQGDQQHRARWKKTYGTSPRPTARRRGA
jgi:restriction system protein